MASLFAVCSRPMDNSTHLATVPHIALSAYMTRGRVSHEKVEVPANVGLIIKTVNVQRAESGYSSAGMETFGLEKGVRELLDMGVEIDCLSIDRSPANIAMMRKKFPQIEIQHDPWHLTKKVCCLIYFSQI